MIIWILFLIIVGFLILQYGKFGRLDDLVPAPESVPVFGNLIRLQVPAPQIWKKLRQYADQEYPIYRLWTVMTTNLNIRHPDDLETIIGNPKFSRKSNLYKLFNSWLGTGLLTSSGPKWQVRRKILTHAFHFNVLQEFVDVFIEESKCLTESLKSEGPTVKNLLQFYSEHTLNIICETAMGTSLKDKGSSFQREYRRAVHDIGYTIVYRYMRPWFKPDFIFKWIPMGWFASKLLKILHGFTNAIIAERKNYHDQTKGRYLSNFDKDSSKANVDDDGGIRKKKLAMLDLLIAAHRNNQIDDKGIREEVDTFMFEGHDTSAMCLCFTTMLLAEHKDIQDRVREEVNAALDQTGGEVTMATLQNLPYLDRCIKESLRLYPSVPLISRRTETDVVLHNYKIPTDTEVHVHILDVHRDPKYWPNPEVFDPDRFLPENTKGRHLYSYVPFSAGPRNCIGQRFAMLEIKASLLFLIHNFYLEPVNYLKDVTFAFDLVLRTVEPLQVKFVPIETTFGIMITAILFCIVAALFVHFIVLHYGKYGRIMNLIPGPRVMPLLGNLYDLHVSSSEIWKLMRQLGNRYYPIYRLWSFTVPLVYIRHPDDVETILGNPKSIQKSEMYDLLMPWFGTGLLTSGGSKWKVRRKILTPAFHFNVLQQFIDIIIEESERMTDLLKNEGGAVVKNLMPFYSEHTLNVICETAMGTSLKDKGSFQHKYRKAVYDMGKVIVYRLIRPWVHSHALFKFFPQGWHQSRLLKILHGFTDEIIAERKDYHEKTNGKYLTGFNDDPSLKDTSDDVGIRKRRLAMLDLLIAAHRNNQIDDKGIREEVDTFMFRGHDTTAVSLCFTTMLLAEHKEIQAKAREEVKAALEQSGGKITMATLQNVPYLERCIKESLRLYPSVPFISRSPEMDVRLSNKLVPTETVVNVLIVDVHRDPNYWPNPEVYDPDRFLPENMKGRHPYAYVPFSAGPRNCIGQRFAMLELKTTLLFLLNDFYFEPVDYLRDMDIDVDLVIRPTRPIRTRFVPIESK
ncbi:uncharacterized protein LOC143348322 [Colletes latitarsis]|uniref:uncharacterized protein LOC143348322 n=1 Tax=Colletes latitarsis TaxID=2605962 RepID=UPI004036F111